MNKWYLITGASSGIGKSISERLLELGYKVVLTSRREEEMKLITQKYTEENYRIIPWDLSDLDSLKEYSKKVNTEIGPISGFVHCAGIQKTLPLSMVSKKRIEDVFNINTFSAILLLSLFSKNNYFNKEGASFLLISSLTAHKGTIGATIYASSKGALEGLLPSASTELITKKIRLNILILGIVKTPMTNDFLSKSTEEQYKKLAESYPLGFGDPSDVNEFAIFLLSDKAKWITGQKFVLDGGHTIKE
jgi:NAD(P)-dependent dehydrogenase (short-subunit alcohol dehydrogenase family)